MRAVLLRCPYCLEGFGPGDSIIRCSRCSASHHRACWDENDHCSVFACNGSPNHSRDGIPGWIEYLPAVLLLFLALHPAFLIPFGFLWFPASVCAMSAAIRLFKKMLNSTRETLSAPALTFTLNAAGIVAILVRLLG